MEWDTQDGGEETAEEVTTPGIFESIDELRSVVGRVLLLIGVLYVMAVLLVGLLR